MEHRNNEQEISMENTSLRQILQMRYLLYIMEKLKIEHCDELKGNTIEQAINDAISRDEDGLIDKDLESYIRSQSKILFRIFDVIVKDSKEKLCFDNTGKYYFNDKNIEFVSDLLDCYEEKNPNCKALLKGRFEDVEDDFCKEFLYEGFLDLARNEFNSLKIEEIDEIWRKLFNPDYREILKLVEDLKTDVEFYVGDIVPEEKNIEVFRKIKDIIRECNDQIVAISKETIEDSEIDLVKDVPIEEIPFIAPLIELKLRRDRAVKGWEKRKGKQN